jgi:class 3 adenylate cyclase/tetratricopeptide (TPR) repeat protein
MSDIRDWLERLELGEYVAVFEAEKIAPQDLTEFSENDLHALGLPMGPRRRVLKAVRAQSDGPSPEIATPAPPREAERRQITVMFCDLVGSTTLSEQLDPEDLRILLQDYQQAAGGVIEHYEGHVAQYLGDGLMTYFGWPQAHEDDAERAVRAGLEIVEAVNAIDAPTPLSVRVGIATGPVVVGETGGGDPSVAKTAVGETPNLAARTQGLAEANSVAIAPQTQRLVGGAFDLESLGEQVLKGIAEPVEIFRVQGEAVTESRFEAQTIGGLTPFVGRETEIAMLLERWEQAKDGEGQVVLLEGEPGIGKSRITQVLRDRVADEPHVRLRYQCSPYYTNSAFYPIIDQLERAAEFGREDSTDVKLDKLEAALAQSTEEVTKIAPLLASMLSLPIDRYPPLDLSPQRQKDDTISALAAQLIGLAGAQPVLLLFEDAHWCDPTTVEILTAVIGGIEAARVLVVITYRPEFDPPWTAHGHVVAQSLSRLGRRQGADMVAKVTAGKSLPDEVLDQIVAKTDGVPLFVEELTKTVLEAGILKDSGDHYDLDGPLPPLAIPSTLQDSLMARLDRLSPVKEVAQIGACIGREFSHDLLDAVSPLRDNELQDALQQLVNSELIFRRGTSSEATYTFKHALVQDAAYESLLRSRRQQLHGRIVDAIGSRFPGRMEAEPELLGHHCEGAGRYAAAVDYFHQAAELALARSALTEAMAHGEKAMELVSKLESGAEPKARELKVRTTLGGIYLLARGWGDPSVREQLRPARDLANSLGDTERLFTALWILWVTYMGRSENQEALATAEEQLSTARASNDSRKLVQAINANAITHCGLGNFEISHDFAEEIDRIYDFDLHHDIVNANNHDTKTGVLNWEISCLWILGRPDRARECWSEQLALAERVGHPFNLAFTYSFPTLALTFMGLSDEALAHEEKALSMAREHDMPLIEVILNSVAGVRLIAAADYSEGLVRSEAGIASWSQFDVWGLRSFYDASSALAMGNLGRVAEARDRIQLACDMGEERHQGMHLAEVWRIRGLLDEMAGQPDDAEKAFRRSCEIAIAQRAKSWQLRAATSLAKLWQSQDKAVEARDLLAPVYDWFTEGFDTPDLNAAKAILQELK